MKILYFLEGTFNSGGTERIVIGKANWLAAHGHDVTILTTDQNNRPDYFPLKGVNRIDMDIMFSQRKNKGVVSYFFERKSKLKKQKKLIDKYVGELKPDIIVSTFRYEITYLPKLKDHSRKFIEIHFSRFYRIQRQRKGIWGFIDKFLTWRDLQQVKKYESLICLTDEDKKNWKGVDNIKVINNYIDNLTESPAPLDNKMMIAVGRLGFQKSFDRLIKAWKLVSEKYPDWKLYIYGEGPLHKELLQLIDSLSLKGIVNICPPTKDIHSKYLESSALLMTSRYEGLPMVMLEAMETGLPVVSFDFQCGPKDVIIDGESGFIIKDDDIDSFAKSIIKLIEDEELRKNMGKKSFELAKKYFPENIMPKWENLFSPINNKRE